MPVLAGRLVMARRRTTLWLLRCPAEVVIHPWLNMRPGWQGCARRRRTTHGSTARSVYLATGGLALAGPGVAPSAASPSSSCPKLRQWSTPDGALVGVCRPCANVPHYLLPWACGPSHFTAAPSTCCSSTAVGPIPWRWRLRSPATASGPFKSHGGQYSCLTGGGDGFYGRVGGGETRWRTSPGTSRPSSHGGWRAAHFAPLSGLPQSVQLV